MSIKLGSKGYDSGIVVRQSIDIGESERRAIIDVVEYQTVAQGERYREARCRWLNVPGLLWIVLGAERECTWRRARYRDKKRCERIIVLVEYRNKGTASMRYENPKRCRTSGSIS